MSGRADANTGQETRRLGRRGANGFANETPAGQGEMARDAGDSHLALVPLVGESAAGTHAEHEKRCQSFGS